MSAKRQPVPLAEPWLHTASCHVFTVLKCVFLKKNHQFVLNRQEKCQIFLKKFEMLIFEKSDRQRTGK